MSCSNCHKNYESGAVKISDYASEVQPTWCGGCGNFGIRAALKRALVELKIAPRDVLLCMDVGCNGNMSDKIAGYRFHSLHGRVLPIAAGAKLANPNIIVIAMGGDGATYSEGIDHLINSFRNNFPITMLVHDNGNYGLTTGQASATTPQDAKRTANPDGPTASTLKPIDLALSLNPSFVGQGFSGEIDYLKEVIKAAINHQKEGGFGFVNILQSCPTYNKETDQFWYLDRTKHVEEFKDFDVNNKEWARNNATDILKQVVTGVIYKDPKIPGYMNRLSYRNEHGSLWSSTTLSEEVRKQDVSGFVKKFV